MSIIMKYLEGRTKEGMSIIMKYLEGRKKGRMKEGMVRIKEGRNEGIKVKQN